VVVAELETNNVANLRSPKGCQGLDRTRPAQ
jgi:hypothetical protein